MGADSRFTFFVASLFMLAIGYWASTFASVFINENRPLMFALFFIGAGLITIHATMSAVVYAKIEKRIAALEGDPETPPKPTK
jgi:hypothetical protein